MRRKKQILRHPMHTRKGMKFKIGSVEKKTRLMKKSERRAPRTLTNANSATNFHFSPRENLRNFPRVKIARENDQFRAYYIANGRNSKNNILTGHVQRFRILASSHVVVRFASHYGVVQFSRHIRNDLKLIM